MLSSQPEALHLNGVGCVSNDPVGRNQGGHCDHFSSLFEHDGFPTVPALIASDASKISGITQVCSLIDCLLKITHSVEVSE